VNDDFYIIFFGEEQVRSQQLEFWEKPPRKIPPATYSHTLVPSFQCWFDVEMFRHAS